MTRSWYTSPMSRTAPSANRLRRVLRWVPAASLAIIQAAAWGAMFSGGMAGVVGWILLLSVIPFLGVAALLVAAIHAVRERRFSRAISGTFFSSLLALWPGAWNFGVGRIAYPASLEKTRPSAAVRLPSE